MGSLRLVALGAICASLLVSGCSRGNATVAGTLEGADRACLYLLVPNGSSTDRYWLRYLPPGYESADELGLRAPDGVLIHMGDRVTVSGALTWDPFQRNCAGEHTLEAEAIE